MQSVCKIAECILAYQKPCHIPEQTILLWDWVWPYHTQMPLHVCIFPQVYASTNETPLACLSLESNFNSLQMLFQAMLCQELPYKHTHSKPSLFHILVQLGHCLPFCYENSGKKFVIWLTQCSFAWLQYIRSHTNIRRSPGRHGKSSCRSPLF
jgi:hypothetical protein